MNINPGGPNSGGGFGFRPGGFLVQHGGHAHPNALAWATFALVLLLVLTVGALIVARFARRGRRHGGPGPGFGPRKFAFGGGPGHRPDPVDVLRWRYARGELSRDAFLEGVADLTAPGAAPPPPPPPAPTV